MKNLIDLTNKTILVTGASSGIGRAIAREASELGGNVVLVGRNEAELQKTVALMARPHAHRYFCHDLVNVDELGDLLAKIFDRDGFKLHGLVHAAGIEVTLPIQFVTPKKFDQAMRLHLYSWVEMVRILTQKHPHQEGLSVVILSSVAAGGGGKCQTVYSASKGASDAAIIPLSKELAPRKVRINSIRPSIIRTPMTEKWAAKKGIENLDDLNRTQVLGLGEPEDVAHLVSFLLSDAARFITGRSISVDGGGPQDSIF